MVMRTWRRGMPKNSLERNKSKRKVKQTLWCGLWTYFCQTNPILTVKSTNQGITKIEIVADISQHLAYVRVCYYFQQILKCYEALKFGSESYSTKCGALNLKMLFLPLQKTVKCTGRSSPAFVYRVQQFKNFKCVFAVFLQYIIPKF